MAEGDEPATGVFGYGTEGVAAFVVVAKVHGYKYSGFYLFDELFGAFHIIFSHPAVYGKHDNADEGNLLPDEAHFCQEVSFGFAYLLRGGLFAPMPVVEVARMEKGRALQVDEEGDAHVGGAERTHAQRVVYVLFSFIYIDGVVRLGAMVLENIFGEEVANVGALLFPGEHFAVEMVGVEVGGQHVELAGTLEQAVVDDAFVGAVSEESL